MTIALEEICKAEQRHDFVMGTIPDRSVRDADQNLLVAAIVSLTAERRGAILHLLKAARFDGSALALVRPMIDATYGARWRGGPGLASFEDLGK
jgi:hypothetical protein